MWGSKLACTCNGNGEGKSNGKSEIRGFFPFDELRVRMTSVEME
jgi:hypothetical protein